MKNKGYILLLVITAISWFACRQEQTASSNSLPDNLFKLHNISSSLFTVDSSVMNSYVVMDTIEKAQLLTPEVVRGSPGAIEVGQSYIIHDMEAKFISKQDKIGNTQPIIVSVHGDDYGSLILLVLDEKNNKLISHLMLSGGFDGGPDNEIGDSLIFFHDMESTIKNDIIKTYLLKIQLWEKDSTRLPLIDSISYMRKILPTGEIKLISKDSIRYSREIDINRPNICW